LPQALYPLMCPRERAAGDEDAEVELAESVTAEIRRKKNAARSGGVLMCV